MKVKGPLSIGHSVRSYVKSHDKGAAFVQVGMKGVGQFTIFPRSDARRKP